MSIFRPWEVPSTGNVEAELNLNVNLDEGDEEFIDVVNLTPDVSDADSEEAEAQAACQRSDMQKRPPKLCDRCKLSIHHVHEGLIRDGCRAAITKTSEYMRIPYATVHRILKTPITDLKSKYSNCGRKSLSLTDSQKAEIKRTVYRMYKNKRVPTAEGVLGKLKEFGFRPELSNKTLRQELRKLGFTYKKMNKRAAVMRSPRLVQWRTSFITSIRKYRTEGRSIVYLDETWYDTHDVILRGWVDNSPFCCLDVPSSRGKRIIILNAGTKNGWIPECLLISTKNIKDCAADYHQDMEHSLFESWFRDKLLPNLPPNSVIVMDNASYHSKQAHKVPRKSSKKQEIIDFLKGQGIEIPKKCTKTDLLLLIAESDVIDKETKYRTDEMARVQGHEVLRLPPYYCVLNPIELIWSQLKHKMRKDNDTPNLDASVVDLVREKTAEIDEQLWDSCVRHVIHVEDNFMGGPDVPQFIININDESDNEWTSSDEE